MILKIFLPILVMGPRSPAGDEAFREDRFADALLSGITNSVACADRGSCRKALRDVGPGDGYG